MDLLDHIDRQYLSIALFSRHLDHRLTLVTQRLQAVRTSAARGILRSPHGPYGHVFATRHSSSCRWASVVYRDDVMGKKMPRQSAGRAERREGARKTCSTLAGKPLASEASKGHEPRQQRNRSRADATASSHRRVNSRATSEIADNSAGRLFRSVRAAAPASTRDLPRSPRASSRESPGSENPPLPRTRRSPP